MHLDKVIMLTQPEVWETLTTNLYLVYGKDCVATVARSIDMFEHTEHLECTNLMQLELNNLYTGCIKDVDIHISQSQNPIIISNILAALTQYFIDNPTE